MRCRVCSSVIDCAKVAAESNATVVLRFLTAREVHATRAVTALLAKARQPLFCTLPLLCERLRLAGLDPYVLWHCDVSGNPTEIAALDKSPLAIGVAVGGVMSLRLLPRALSSRIAAASTPHSFEPHVFHRPGVVCAHCLHSIAVVLAAQRTQGVQCRRCKMPAHHHCHAQISSICPALVDRAGAAAHTPAVDPSGGESPRANAKGGVASGKEVAAAVASHLDDAPDV